MNSSEILETLSEVKQKSMTSNLGKGNTSSTQLDDIASTNRLEVPLHPSQEDPKVVGDEPVNSSADSNQDKESLSLPLSKESIPEEIQLKLCMPASASAQFCYSLLEVINKDRNQRCDSEQTPCKEFIEVFLPKSAQVIRVTESVCDVSCTELQGVSPSEEAPCFLCHKSSDVQFLRKLVDLTTINTKVPVVKKLTTLLRRKGEHPEFREGSVICKTCLNLVNQMELSETVVTTAKQQLSNIINKVVNCYRDGQSAAWIKTEVEDTMPTDYVETHISSSDNMADDGCKRNLRKKKLRTCSQRFGYRDGLRSGIMDDVDIKSEPDPSDSEFQPYNRRKKKRKFQVSAEDFDSHASTVPKKRGRPRKHLKQTTDFDMKLEKDELMSNFMISTEENYIRCQLCDEYLNHKGRTMMSMQLHIHDHHPEVYKKEADPPKPAISSEVNDLVGLLENSSKAEIIHDTSALIGELTEAEKEGKGSPVTTDEACTDVDMISDVKTILNMERNEDQDTELQLTNNLYYQDMSDEYKCSKCPRMFSTIRKLNQHKKVYHTKYECETCGRNFKLKRLLQDHRNVHLENKDKPYKCPICNLGISSKSYLNVHIREIHSEDKQSVDCSVCGKTFKRKNDLKTHFRIHQNIKPFLCNICGESFYNSNLLILHKVKHGPKNYVCDQCGRRFYLNSQLTHHIRATHLDSGEKGFCCSKCGKKLKKRETLLKHESVCAKFHCLKCGREFKKKYTLNLHERACGVPKNSDGFRCEMCGKVLKNLQRWKIHKGMHENKVFSCDICLSLFVSQKSLDKHRPSHFHQQEHVCTVCGVYLRTQEGLRRHARTHSGEKPYQCMQCQQQFMMNYELQNHLQMFNHHQHGDMPACFTCGKSFKNRINLSRHLKSKHADPPPKSPIKKTHPVPVRKPKEMFKRSPDKMIPTIPDVPPPSLAFPTARAPVQMPRSTVAPTNSIIGFLPNIPNEMCFICSYCGQTFPDQHSLNNHIRSHPEPIIHSQYAPGPSNRPSAIEHYPYLYQ